MMGILTRLFPAGLWMRLMGFALVFTIGLAVGNQWATERALQRELQASADRQRENHLVLFNEFKRRNAEFKAHIEQQIDADAAAYAMLTKGKADADLAAQQARASLRIALGESAKLRETNDGLRNVNEMLAAEIRPNDPGCVLSAGVRRALDFASGAAPDPGSGNPEAPAPGVLDGADPSAASLACEQLARGYVALSEHDRMLTAWVLSWQTWARAALQ